MKKVILSVLLAVLAISVSAQINPKAIGLRLGGGNGFGTEVSFQKMLNSKNRLELDFGIHSEGDRYYNYSAIGASGIYQWTWAIDGGFYWFAGAGGQVGIWDYNNKPNHDYDDSGVWLGILGQAGIEYHFSEIPLMIGADTRPGFIFTKYEDSDLMDMDLAISVRYTF